MGRDLIGCLQQMHNGSALYLEEVRTGRKMLATQSMRRYPQTTNATSILKSLRPTSETLPGNPTKFSVVDRAEVRNNSGVLDRSAPERDLMASYNLTTDHNGRPNRFSTSRFSHSAPKKGNNWKTPTP